MLWLGVKSLISQVRICSAARLLAPILLSSNDRHSYMPIARMDKIAKRLLPPDLKR